MDPINPIGTIDFIDPIEPYDLIDLHIPLTHLTQVTTTNEMGQAVCDQPILNTFRSWDQLNV